MKKILLLIISASLLVLNVNKNYVHRIYCYSEEPSLCDSSSLLLSASSSLVSSSSSPSSSLFHSSTLSLSFSLLSHSSLALYSSPLSSSWLTRFHTTYILVDIGIDVMEFGLVENSLGTVWNRIKESHHGRFFSGKDR